MWYIAQSLIAVDHRGCLLKWETSSDKELDGYNIYMKTSVDDEFKKMNSEPVDGLEWMSPPLRLDTKYFFRITAKDRSDNESDPGPTIPFILRDGTEDKNVIYVAPPTSFKLEEAEELEKDVSEETKGVTIRFELGGLE